MVQAYRVGPIRVPKQVMLHRGLNATAKLLWIILAMESPTFTQIPPRRVLQARSGLSGPSVTKGLVDLKDAGLLRPLPLGRGNHDWAALPQGLLLDRRLGPQAKLMYAFIQLLPDFFIQTVTTTYRDLCSLTDLSSNTVKDAIKHLSDLRWIASSQANRRRPLVLTLRQPEEVGRTISVARQRLDRAPFMGEALMREYLTLLVDSDEYDDDASPGFLINPYTGEEMQFDRYYPPYVAFEFNGPQHYGPTELYPNEEEARKQQGRDLIKRGICASRGINLIYIHPEDLSLEGMLRKVQGLLPVRSLDGQEELIAFLESRARPYRRKAEPHR